MEKTQTPLEAKIETFEKDNQSVFDKKEGVWFYFIGIESNGVRIDYQIHESELDRYSIGLSTKVINLDYSPIAKNGRVYKNGELFVDGWK